MSGWRPDQPFTELPLLLPAGVELETRAMLKACIPARAALATPDQIEFIHMVVEELTQTGVMDPDRLFQSPFTDFSAQGPLGLFPPARVSEMVGVLEEISLRAVA